MKILTKKQMHNAFGGWGEEAILRFTGESLFMAFLFVVGDRFSTWVCADAPYIAAKSDGYTQGRLVSHTKDRTVIETATFEMGLSDGRYLGKSNRIRNGRITPPVVDAIPIVMAVPME